MADFVVGSKVKALVKESGMNTAGTLIDAVDAKVSELVKDAVKRAQANGRKTVRDCDI
jgi:histone H3/H4